MQPGEKSERCQRLIVLTLYCFGETSGSVDILSHPHTRMRRFVPDFISSATWFGTNLTHLSTVEFTKFGMQCDYIVRSESLL